ncbi:MAG: hypothetical protein B7Y90_13840 [Alphaproteobacteria bacterium 32-64-14]|nr:MAG: hypothetical protein B7Y90_13840 [Alphaproteobacteria bacterium 32-64-14]
MQKALALLFGSLLVAGRASAAPPAAAKPSASEDPQAKRITGSTNYVPTFGLRASISRGFKVHGVLAIDAGLDVPKEATRKLAEAIRPRLMSQMRDAVLNYASLSYVVGERPDVDIVRARLQKAVDQVLGKGEARVALASVIVFQE